jgi:putative membrane protein
LQRFLIRAVFAALGLWVADKLLASVYISGAFTLAIAAVLLGAVNAILRPVLFILTLPFTILTLGLFLLVLNACMIGIVDFLLPGFRVHGLFAGIEAAIITGVASWLGHLALGEGRDRR